MAERQGNMLDQDPSSSNNNQEQNTYSGPDIDLLKSIDSTLKEILSRNKGMSQSAARSSMPGDRGEANKWEPNRSRQNAANTKSGSSMSSSLNFKSVTDGFLDGLEDTLLESVLGPDFKNKIHNTISGFADAMGVGVGDIPKKDTQY